MNFKKSKVIQGDCLDKLKLIPDNYIDFICTDLPYGVTSNKLDIKIPFEPLWEQYWRVLKPNGAIALYAQGLFYIDLVTSNRKNFRYDLVWNKKLVTGFLNSKKQPLRQHEQIALFYKKQPTYNPQMTQGKPLHSKGKSYLKKEPKNQNYNNIKNTDDNRAGETKKYPTSIITFQKPHPSKSLHKTEKSVECNEWLIKTYSNEGDIILDSTSGSGSLGEACINTNRDFIIIEKNEDDFSVGKNRVIDCFNKKGIVFDKSIWEETIHTDKN